MSGTGAVLDHLTPRSKTNRRKRRKKYVRRIKVLMMFCVKMLVVSSAQKVKAITTIEYYQLVQQSYKSGPS